MTKDEYESFLRKCDLSQKIIEDFFERTLTNEEDILDYTKRTRAFCSNYSVRMNSAGTQGLLFIRSLLYALVSWRTMDVHMENYTIFMPHLPTPSKRAIQESRRHRENQEREFRYRSDTRRGFYHNGEPTQDCGKDLKRWLDLYEYKTKREKARA